MGDGLIAMAEHGQPVTITPFTLMGAMTSVSLPAAFAQQNAEALFGVVLSQLVKPGAPVKYGAFTSNVDVRSGVPCLRHAGKRQGQCHRGPTGPALRPCPIAPRTPMP